MVFICLAALFISGGSKGLCLSVVLLWCWPMLSLCCLPVRLHSEGCHLLSQDVCSSSVTNTHCVQNNSCHVHANPPSPLFLSLRKTGVKSLPHTNTWAAHTALFVITLTLFWLRLNTHAHTHTDTIINMFSLNHNTHLTAITHTTPFQFPGRLNPF